MWLYMYLFLYKFEIFFVGDQNSIVLRRLVVFSVHQEPLPGVAQVAHVISVTLDSVVIIHRHCQCNR